MGLLGGDTMKTTSVIRQPTSALLLASAGVWALMAGSAYAQATPAQPAPATSADNSDTLQEVVVTGIRASLQRAQAIKRDASSVVEAVTLEDLGKFADTNVADALQRMPGVEVDRNDNGVTGDRVSIRGLGPAYNQVTLNGRVILTGGDEGIINMRQFNFDVIPTDTIAGIEVYKTPTAELPEAGLAGEVDVKTLRPLDYHPRSGGDTFGSLSVSGIYDDLADRTTEKYNLILGGKFLNRTLGLYVGAANGTQPVANSELFSRFTYANLSFDDNGTGVANRTINNVLVPSQITADVNSGAITRTSYVSGAQWKPDSHLEVNADFMYAKEDNNQDRSYADIYLAGQGIFTGIAKPGGYNVVDGQLLGFNTADLEYSGTAPQVGSDPYPLIYNNDQALSSGGVNAKWKDDKWDLGFDLAHSETSYRQDLRAFVGSTPALENEVTYNGLTELPGFTGFTNLHSPAGTATPVSFEHYNLNETRLTSAKIDIAYHINNDLTVKAGFRYQQTHIQVSAGTLIDSAPDAATGYTNAAANAITATQVTNQPANYMKGLGFGIALPYSNYFLNQSIVPSIVDANYQGASPDLGPAFREAETTDAGYIQADGKSTLFSVPFDANAGLRAVETSLSASANSVVTIQSPLGPIVSQTNVPTADSNSYWNFLPAANANFHLLHNLNMRLGVAQVMSRPEYNLTAPLNTIDISDPNNPLTDKSIPPAATAGNTHLKPLTSWNYDVTFEYYTQNKGAFYTSFFYKDVKNFILTELTPNQILPGQGATLFDVTHPINAQAGEAYGAEFGLDQSLSALWTRLDGFGIQANYTYTRGFVKVNSDGFNLNGFPGSSIDNFNSIFYYEKHGIGIRLAYAYRSNYFSSLTDNRTDTPTFTRGFGQLNLSASYKITENLEANYNVTNLTHENRSDYIPPNMFKSYVQLPSVMTFGLRATF